MTDSLSVLVTGATGNQGGAVTQALLARGHKVRAFTRNPDSPSAKKLSNQGVDVIQGNFDDSGKLINVLQNVDAFYLMGTPFEAGVDGESKQGIALANAAKAANVGHLVYGSVASAEQNTNIPHFDSKYKVEEHIKTLDIPYTISAPVYFMDNAVAPWAIDALKTGKIPAAMPGDRILQQISVKNIGDFVASLITRRSSVFGKRFNIAGDELTGEQSAAILSQAIGKPVQFESFPVSALKQQDADMGAMFEWFDTTGYDVDIKALHSEFSDIEWLSYSDWAHSQNWDFLKQKAVS